MPHISDWTHIEGHKRARKRDELRVSATRCENVTLVGNRYYQ